MSSDRLRAAAKTLRQRAEAATPGPWEYVVSEFEDLGGDVLDVTTHGCSCDYSCNRTDPAYIATMHPVVGLALANWLDAQADTTCDCGVDEFALAVANLILGTARNVDSSSPF